MVLYIMKWNIRPKKLDDYMAWTESAIKRTLGAGGVIEFAAYRPSTGNHQVATTYQFADMATWAAWQDHPDVLQVLDELYGLATDVYRELWGDSPVVPKPIRPGG